MNNGILRRFAVAVALPAVALVGLAVPVQADLGQCASGRMCFWHNQGYTSTFFSLTGSDAHLGNNSDEAHSVYNRTNVAWVLYDDQDFSDTNWCIPAGVRNRDIGASPYNFGDKITSARRLGSNSCSGYRNVIAND